MKQLHILVRFNLWVSLCILTWVAPALADNKPIGMVVAVRGSVVAVDGRNQSRRLKLKSSLFRVDTVKTGARGRIQMMFKDNALISLGRNSIIKIADYAWNPEQKKGVMRTRVTEGIFRIMGGAITKVSPKNVITETPAATIGIRGSMYSGKVVGESLTVLFQGGKGITISNAAGTVAITKPGFGSLVKGPQAVPSPPARFKGQALADFEQEFSEIQDDSKNEPDAQEPSGQKTSKDEDGSNDRNQSDTNQSTSEDKSPPSNLEGEAPQPHAFNPVEMATDIVNQAVNDATIDTTQKQLTTQISETEETILNLLQELGFSGSRASSVPDDGFEYYEGTVQGQSVDNASLFNGNVELDVNWFNKKFLGSIEETSSESENPKFIFGDVSETQLQNIKVVGSDLSHGESRVGAIDGSGSFGQFYGEKPDALGMAINGVDVNLQDSSDRDTWTANIAALHKTPAGSQSSMPKGTHTWDGFVVGIAEDMAAPDQNRRIFMNKQTSDFSLDINKDTGIIHGHMSANDFDGSDRSIKNLQIGDDWGSAYVLDDSLIAILGGSDSITSGASTGGLKEYGNFMVAEKSDSQLSSYTTWGFWEIAFHDPVSQKDYHVHQPGALWVAGPRTPASTIDNLIDTQFVGTYSGGAEGVKIDSRGIMSQLTGGSTDLTIDFDSSANNPVTGTISFNEARLNVISNRGAVNSSGFQAEIDGAVSSAVNGSYYGPQAESIGGNFGAKMSSGEKYHGIFAGSR